MSVRLAGVPRVMTGVGVSALVIAIAATAASGAMPASSPLPGVSGILPGTNPAGVPWGACDPGSSAETCDDNTWLMPHNQAWQGVDNMVNVAVAGDFRALGGAAETEGLLVVKGDATFARDGEGVYNVGAAGVGSRVTPEHGADFLLVGGDAEVSNSTQRVLVGAVDSSQESRFGAIGVAGEHRFSTSAPNGTYGYLGEWTSADHNVLHDQSEASTRVAAYDTLFDSIGTYSQQCYADLAATAPITATYASGAGNAAIAAVPGDLTVEGTTATFAMPADAADGDIVTFDIDASSLAGVSSFSFVGFPDNVTVLINLGGDTVDLNMQSVDVDGAPFYPFPSAMPPLLQKTLWNVPEASTIELGGGAQYPGSWLIGSAGSTTTVTAPGMNGRFYTAGDVVHTGSGTEFHNYAFTGQLGCVLADSSATPTPTASVTPSVSASPSVTPSVSASPTVTPSVSPSPSAEPSVSPSPSVTPSVSPSPSTEPSTTASPTPSAEPSVSASPSTTPTSLPTSSPEPELTTFPTASPEPTVTGTSPTAEASVNPEPTATATTGTATTPESTATATTGSGSLSGTDGDEQGASSGAGSTSGTSLPTTGVDEQVWRSAGIAGLMLALGGGLLVLARRQA